MMIRLCESDAETGRLNGYWVAVDAQLAGVRLAQESLSKLSLHLRAGTFVFGVDEGVIALDGASRPSAMDVLVTRGPNCARFIPAIYEQAGGMLRICCDLSGQERPREFKAPLESRHFLITYRRGAAPHATRRGAWAAWRSRGAA